MNLEKISKFLSLLNSKCEKEFSYYLHGGCLEYAKRLQEYVGGKIVYERQLQHFLLYKDGYFFDRRGNVTKQINQQNIIFDPFSYYKASFFDGFTGKETIQK